MGRAAERYLTVVVPAFNERPRIAATLEHILAFFDRVQWDADVIVVLDGSTDGTGDEARRVAARDPRVAVIDNGVNRGKGYAVKVGMLAAEGRLVLFTDADLSTPIEETPRLIEAISAGADIAIGSRALATSQVDVRQPWWRERMGRTFNAFVRSLALVDIKDSQCGFKCFRREVARRVFALQRISRFAFDVELLVIARSLGYRTTEVPIRWINHQASSVNPLTAPLSMLLDAVRIRMNYWKGRYRAAQPTAGSREKRMS